MKKYNSIFCEAKPSKSIIELRKRINQMISFGKNHSEKDFFDRFINYDLMEVASAYKQVYNKELTSNILEKYDY